MPSVRSRLAKASVNDLANQAGADIAARMRNSGRLLVGGVVTEISHAFGTVTDSRGRERDAYMVEEGTSSAYAVFQMPVQAPEAIKAIRAIASSANLLDYEWTGLDSTDGKSGSGPFCRRTKRRISGEFHDGGDIEVIELTRDADPEVEFEAPDGTRELIDTEQAISALRTIAAESGGKWSKKAGKSASKVSKKPARPKRAKAAKKAVQRGAATPPKRRAAANASTKAQSPQKRSKSSSTKRSTRR